MSSFQRFKCFQDSSSKMFQTIGLKHFAILLAGNFIWSYSNLHKNSTKCPPMIWTRIRVRFPEKRLSTYDRKRRRVCCFYFRFLPVVAVASLRPRFIVATTHRSGSRLRARSLLRRRGRCAGPRPPPPPRRPRTACGRAHCVVYLIPFARTRSTGRGTCHFHIQESEGTRSTRHRRRPLAFFMSAGDCAGPRYC